MDASHTICLTQGCDSRAKRGSEYCLFCIRAVEIDSRIGQRPDPETIEHDCIVSCSVCSFEDFASYTKRKVNLLNTAGLRCHCRQGLLSIEELPSPARIPA